MYWILCGLFDQFWDESLAESCVEVVYEVFFRHLYNLNNGYILGKWTSKITKCLSDDKKAQIKQAIIFEK